VNDPSELVERLEQAQLLAYDPPWATHILGIDWPQLDPAERQMVIGAQRHALEAGIERLRRKAADGDSEARLALGEIGIKLKRPRPDVVERIRKRADRVAASG